MEEKNDDDDDGSIVLHPPFTERMYGPRYNSGSRQGIDQCQPRSSPTSFISNTPSGLRDETKATETAGLSRWSNHSSLSGD